jgi:hypothetical protein
LIIAWENERSCRIFTGLVMRGAQFAKQAILSAGWNRIASGSAGIEFPGAMNNIL